MGRMDKLWRAVDGPGKVPNLDAQAVKRRVNAALDADLGERKIYMKQKIRFALMAAALAAAVTGSALAVNENWDMLSAFFQGDTSPAQEYVNNTVYSVSDENYSLTVEGAVADEDNLYMVVSVTALSEEAKTALVDRFFWNIDTWWVRTVEAEAYLQANPEATRVPDDVPHMSGFGGGELPCAQENTRRFSLNASFSHATPSALLFRLRTMEEDAVLDIPVTPAPTLTLELNATGIGYHGETAQPVELTVQRVHLSPFNFQLETTENSTLETKPRFLFRMADGTIRTQAQMMVFTDGWATKMVTGTYTADYVQRYRFKEIQELDNISSLILFDMEYPLDGSRPFPAEHDPSLDPFSLPQMENYLLPVRALTETLGGTCDWDPENGDVTCTYRGISVVLHPGSDTALVDGEPVKMGWIPELQSDSLCAGGKPFFDAWGIDGFITSTRGEDVPDPDKPGVSTIETFYLDWYIIP